LKYNIGANNRRARKSSRKFAGCIGSGDALLIIKFRVWFFHEA